MGCIPVLFLKNILTKAYPWFFPPNTTREADMTVYIPHSHIRLLNFSVVEQLKLISQEEIMRKQEAIRAFAPNLLYAVPPSSMAPYIGLNGKPGQLKSGGSWAPPMKDAVDVMLDHIAAQIKR
jgi:hypothetical protein